MNKQELINAIEELKKAKNAIILAHYYSNSDIQDIADFLGDSLELSKKAATTEAKIIVFAGVHFMAETAAIISPNKKVFVPVQGAGCSLADGVTSADLRAWKAANPGGIVVSYVNTTADVKSETDYCCTSANALKVIKHLPKEAKIFFVPDSNLGGYIKKAAGRNMDIYEGCCFVHKAITAKMVLDRIAEYPQADVLIHPESECSHNDTILNHPNCYMYSTSGILRHAKESPKKQFIIATENGTLHKLQKDNPNKQFIPISKDTICKYMKMATLQDIYESLKEEKYLVTISPKLREKAILPIRRMMEI
ncbi:MAG: quinolinate synthase NadA [Bacteroidales bacterium]